MYLNIFFFLNISFLGELDDKMRWLKNFERLLEIQRSIVWPSVTELDPKAFIPDVWLHFFII